MPKKITYSQNITATCIVFFNLSYDIVSGSVIKPCIKNDNAQVD